MESSSNKKMDAPPLCANGCGFYGSAANKNLCSKCYKDFLLKQKNNITAKSTADELADRLEESLKLKKGEDQETKNSDLVDESFFTNKSSCVASENPCASVSVAESASMKNKKRCKSCNKKVGLTGFQCRCGDVFCGKHRYPEEHVCTVDYKEIGRKALAKQNPICKADRLACRV